MSNAISWFEIPAKNYEKAKKFYNTVLGIEITDSPMPEGKYGMFPHDQDNNGVGGGLVEMEGLNPSPEGVTVYLNGGNDLNIPLSRVEGAGGKVVYAKNRYRREWLYGTVHRYRRQQNSLAFLELGF